MAELFKFTEAIARDFAEESTSDGFRLSPDGKHLVGLSAGVFYHVDTESGAFTFSTPTDSDFSPAFSFRPESSIVHAGIDGELYHFDCDSHDFTRLRADAAENGDEKREHVYTFFSSPSGAIVYGITAASESVHFTEHGQEVRVCEMLCGDPSTASKCFLSEGLLLLADMESLRLFDTKEDFHERPSVEYPAGLKVGDEPPRIAFDAPRKRVIALSADGKIWALEPDDLRKATLLFESGLCRRVWL